MEKIYLVKKDPTKEGPDNWITMNGFEFWEFIKTPEGASRKKNFICLDPCGDDFAIIIECDKKMARKLRMEKDHKIYLQKYREKTGYTIFSYSSICSEDGEISGEEMVKDESSVVEDEAIRRCELDDLRRCLKYLPAIELKILQLCFSLDGMTETKCAEILGIKRSAVHFYKQEALDTLKFLMSNKFRK